MSRREHIGWGVILAIVLTGALASAIRAQQSPQQPPTSPYQTMLDDFRGLDGAMSTSSNAMTHFKASLQVALDQVVKDQQKAAAEAKAADERLAWVLDNWVKKP